MDDTRPLIDFTANPQSISQLSDVNFEGEVCQIAPSEPLEAVISAMDEGAENEEEEIEPPPDLPEPDYRVYEASEAANALVSMCNSQKALERERRKMDTFRTLVPIVYNKENNCSQFWLGQTPEKIYDLGGGDMTIFDDRGSNSSLNLTIFDDPMPSDSEMSFDIDESVQSFNIDLLDVDLSTDNDQSLMSTSDCTPNLVSSIPTGTCTFFDIDI